jgi:uncharacterized protein (DUF2147 family)
MQKNLYSKMKLLYCRIIFLLFILSYKSLSLAQVNADSFVGYWITGEKDAIVELKRCSLFKNAPPTGLCGTIVWDVHHNNPNRTNPLDCNRQVFQATKYDKEAWIDGWAFDTRVKKFYNAKLRLKDGNLHVRAFVGNEMNGQTEIFRRVDVLPSGCENIKPESVQLK